MAYPRRQYQNSKRKRPSRTYRSYKASQPRAKISNGGVGGAANSMMPKPMPPPQEVKTQDEALSFNAAGAAVSGFNFVLSTRTVGAAQQSPLSSIVPGTGPNQRIGRQIRVVGIVLRGVVNSATNIGGVNEGDAWTMDMIWDKQPNQALPTIAQVYDTGPGLSVVNLPNANFVKRFSFAKRIQTSGRAGIPTAQTIVDCTIKTNRLVSYVSNLATTLDLEVNNLLFTLASTDPNVQFTGVVRMLYVDA